MFDIELYIYSTTNRNILNILILLLDGAFMRGNPLSPAESSKKSPIYKYYILYIFIAGTQTRGCAVFSFTNNLLVCDSIVLTCTYR